MMGRYERDVRVEGLPVGQHRHFFAVEVVVDEARLRADACLDESGRTEYEALRDEIRSNLESLDCIIEAVVRRKY